MVLGKKGSGKSMLARDALRPVQIDSFDKGGTNTKEIRDLILSGDIVATTDYEDENPYKPTAFVAWKNRMQERLSNGYFDHFGTYMLDSFTFWSRACMNRVLELAKPPRLGEKPLFNEDFPTCREYMLNALDLLKAIPCDVIVTGHVEYSPDENMANSQWRLVTVGKTESLILGQFDECWIARTRVVDGKLTYQIQTGPVDGYVSSTRVGGLKGLNTFEEPSIRSIRAKVGWPTQDKPPLKTIMNNN
jgi:hypothetical protein